VSATLEKFAALDEMLPEERETLAEYLERVEFSEGACLFRDSSESEELLLLTEGRVRLLRGGRLLGVLGAGETLGGLGLVLIGRRQLEAHAESGVVALALTRARYLRLRLDEPSIALKLLEGVVSRFAAAVRSLLAPVG
jgi:CRP-like cAMP-binding protein